MIKHWGFIPTTETSFDFKRHLVRHAAALHYAKRRAGLHIDRDDAPILADLAICWLFGRRALACERLVVRVVRVRRDRRAVLVAGVPATLHGATLDVRVEEPGAAAATAVFGFMIVPSRSANVAATAVGTTVGWS